MGRKCCVPSCNSNYDAIRRQGQSPTSTFKFPDNPELRKAWVRVLNRNDDWQPGSTASICIHHFQPEDIVRYEKPAKLKPEAVPSIFERNQQDHRIKRGRPRKMVVEHLDNGESIKDSPQEEPYKVGLTETDIITPASEVLEEMITDFQRLIDQIEKKCDNLGSWKYNKTTDILHLYCIHDDVEKDSPIYIENSIKIFPNLSLVLFLKDVKQAQTNLEWILGHDYKISRWSQVKILMQKYDCKTHINRDLENQPRELLMNGTEDNVLDFDEHEFSSIENNDVQVNQTGNESYKSDGDSEVEIKIEYLDIFDDQSDNMSSEQLRNNPIKTVKDRVRTQTERMERRKARETMQALKASKHKCFICDREHESSEAFEHHLTDHTDMLPYHCGRCSSEQVVVRTLASLNRHFLMHLKPLKCRECDVRFSSHGTRMLHERTGHGDVKPMSCDRCGKQFQSVRSFQHHYKIHTNPESMRCKLCSKQLSSVYELKLHMRIHTKEKPNKCPFCTASFNRVSNLVQHKRRFHCQEKPYQCNECVETFLTNAKLKSHATVHDLGKQSVHQSPRKQSSTPSTKISSDSIKEYSCEFCKKVMSSSKQYYSHMRQHRKRFQCSYCGLRFGQRRDFVDHENTHTGNRPYQCELCPMTFKTASTYFGHRSVHSVLKKHSCDECGHRFSRLRHLTQHKKTHVPQKQFVCRQCHRKFQYKNDLQQHVDELHHNEEFTKVQQVVKTVQIPVADPINDSSTFNKPPAIVASVEPMQTVQITEAIVLTAEMLSNKKNIILQQ
ncbi:zinc finger protein 436-like [Uranotaenia lowii]|uniref:zinc finger protein 436-like n=1 Tax=Uranotaenia lowii TaxID=190385 RepID=UPI00247A9BBC|nr:zinc finger protein 436-like [Uranotaenia lowii]